MMDTAAKNIVCDPAGSLLSLMYSRIVGLQVATFNLQYTTVDDLSTRCGLVDLLVLLSCAFGYFVRLSG